MPAQAMVPVTASDDQRWDAMAFYEFNQTQLGLARVLMRKQRPYAAEYQLGQSALTTGVLVSDRPKLLKLHVQEANTWAMAGQLLKSQRPAEAVLALDYAIGIWREILAEFPHAKRFRSGVHGALDDYAWLRSVIGPPGLAQLDRDEPIAARTGIRHAPETAFEHQARARAWFEVGKFLNAIRFFEASAQHRESQRAYPWLHLAATHELMGHHDQAVEWLMRAEAAISETPSPPIELQALYRRVKRQIDHGVRSDASEGSGPNVNKEDEERETQHD